VKFRHGSQNEWFSPDISICQSSGWGKSRVVRQLSALVPVLYLSYQGTKNKEYPERTSRAIDFLRLEVDQKYEGILTRLHLTNISISRLVFAALRYKAFWTEKRQEILGGREQNEDANEQFIDAVFNNHDFWVNVENDWNNAKFSLTQLCSEDSKENLLVVVVFDEARGLLNDEDPNSSLVLAIRRSLASVYIDDTLHVNMFAVFMDTFFSTPNFAPTMVRDSSARQFQGDQLFDPYLLPDMNDVRYDDKQDWLEDESVVGLGRPLWTTIFKAVALEHYKSSLERNF
jgi:hypothetical protein